MSALHDTIAGALAGRSKLSDDLMLLLDSVPGLAGLGLFVTMRSTDGENVAWTDGKELVVEDGYWRLPQNQRLGVLTHELLHVGLAHPLRGARLRATDTTYDHDLWNIACDSTVNYAMSALRNVMLPRGCVDINDLEIATGVKLKGRSAEGIYAILKNAAVTIPIGNAMTADRLAGDVHDNVKSFAVDADNERIEAWNNRTAAALGNLPGLNERLRGDLPTVTTPWNTVLRSFIRRFCGVRTTPDYRRPHRRWLSMQPLATTLGVVTPIHYGQRPGPAGRLAIVADTSGSIDAEVPGRFTAEIINLMRQTGAHIRLITADAAVHQIEDFAGAAGIERLRRFRYHGGGGTDFGPAIAAAAAWQPDALVYLTDLYGNCGPKPAFPVLWAVCPRGSTEMPPFGQRVELR